MSADESKQSTMTQSQEGERELPASWRKVHGAIWLLGLAILAWQGWWWPGILVLVAISGLAEALMQGYSSRTKQEMAQKEEVAQLDQERATWLPSVCPNCGGPISVSTVRWTGNYTADCPYCKGNLKRP
jgi:hypothetical protein